MTTSEPAGRTPVERVGGGAVDDAGRPPAPPGDRPRPDRPLPGAGPAGRPSLGWTELGVMVGAFAVLAVLTYLGAALTLGAFQASTNVVLAVVAVLILLSVLIALAVRVRSLAAVGVRATTWRWLLAGVGVGVLARALAIGLALAWIAVTGDGSNPQQELLGTAAAGGTELVVLLLVGAVLTPIAEELAFRGVVYGALRRYGVLLALIVSAAVFALAHGVSVLLPLTLVLGALNALLYERSRSIWPSIVSHAVYNALGFTAAALVLG